MMLAVRYVGGQIKIAPSPDHGLDWDRLWGTGPHWGQLPAATPKPLVGAFGTSEANPVYVDVHSDAIPSWLGLLVTVCFALVGAFGAQLYAHNRAVERQWRDHYTEGFDLVAGAGATVVSRMNAAVASLGHPEFREAINAVNDASLGLAAAALSIEARAGSADPVVLAVSRTQDRIQEFWDAARTYEATAFTSNVGYDELAARTQKVVDGVNSTADAAHLTLNGNVVATKPRRRWEDSDG